MQWIGSQVESYELSPPIQTNEHVQRIPLHSVLFFKQCTGKMERTTHAAQLSQSKLQLPRARRLSSVRRHPRMTSSKGGAPWCHLMPDVSYFCRTPGRVSIKITYWHTSKWLSQNKDSVKSIFCLLNACPTCSDSKLNKITIVKNELNFVLKILKIIFSNIFTANAQPHFTDFLTVPKS